MSLNQRPTACPPSSVASRPDQHPSHRIGNAEPDTCSIARSSRLPNAIAVLALSTALLLPCSAAKPKSQPTAKPAPVPLNYEQHVRPILKANCFDCHGESEGPKGGLDLRLRRLMVQGGKSGPAIVPGHPEDSPLLQLVERGEMPKRQRKLTEAEVDILRRWVKAGAPTLGPEPTEAPRGMLISEAERQHWSFQPLRQPTPPRTNSLDRARTPIDAFIAADLRQHGQGFSPEAPAMTLLRRASLDLAGIPPTPEHVRQFLTNSAPDAFERMVDQLLDSPQYGERWGRHWLDIAGYADSDGFIDADNPRDYAWKYRDWVIQALNRDMPFNRFVLEQLAGDELVPLPHKNLSPEHAQLLVATGFLRMAADGTEAGGVDQTLFRNAVVSDTLKIVSTSLLGLSVGCAQCHDHRYDPIPQADYYRLRAVFEPALDWKNWKTPSQRLVSLATDADRAKSAEIEAEAAKLSGEREAKQKQFIAEALKKHLEEKFQDPLRAELRAALDTPEKDRKPEQKKLIDDHPSVKISPGVLYQYNPKAAEELKSMDARIGEIRARKPREDFIHALTEPAGALPVTFLFHRGDPNQPKDKFGPGGLTVLPAGPVTFPESRPGASTSGRRLAFAQWVTSTNNPLLPRLIVNRVWMHHFGQGLVGTPADFGLNGERPTHPELLEWLASTFTQEPSPANQFLGCNWSLKKLHRLILHSSVWRQAGRGPEAFSEIAALKPISKRAAKKAAASTSTASVSTPRPYSHALVRRLDAEVIRDSILAVTGALNLKPGGAPVPIREDAFGQVVVGIDKKEGDSKQPVEVSMGGEEFRRSVYIQVRRSKPVAFLTTFDAPVMEVNCERRTSSTVAPQALMLMNSAFILQQAELFAARLQREAPESLRNQVILAWQLAFNRPPTAREMIDASEFLQRQSATSNAGASAPAPTSKPDAAKSNKPTGPDAQALTSLCQVLLSANELIYLD